jgi:two-component system sensor histidine kinase YcbA
MALRDLLTILEVTTRQMLGSDRADIRLECRYQENIPIREHYRVLSILKNLVTNAVEAIQSASGHGSVRVDAAVEGDALSLSVCDDGPGIAPRAMKMLFQVGYSTKFDPDTGNLNRGVGLSAVQFLIEELGGTIQVQSQPGQGAQFFVSLPLDAVTGGNYENLHH